jgi:hypothetical protein
MASTITDRVGGAVDGVPVQRRGYGRIRLVPSSGVDTIVCAGSPAVQSWTLYQEFIMRPTGANTGAVTINPDEQGAKSLKTPAGGALPSGTINGNQDITFYYDGTNCVLIGPY